MMMIKATQCDLLISIKTQASLASVKTIKRDWAEMACMAELQEKKHC